MTDIRALLREATADLEVTSAGAAEQVRRAASRRRRGGLAVVGVAAVAAGAIATPVALIGGGASHPLRPAHHSAAPKQPVREWEPGAGDVASGFGAVWALKCCGGSTGPSWVDRLDPTTGRQLRRIVVPGPATSVAAGAGRVWVIGATDGGPSAISALDPATSRVVTLRLPNPLAEPDDIGFAHGSAWVTFGLLNQVWRLTATPSGVEKRVLHVPGTPAFIATTGDGQLWVEQEAGAGRVTRILISRRSTALGASKPWGGAIYPARTGNGVMWGTTADRHSVVPLLPSRIGGNSCINCNLPLVTVHGQINAVTSTSRGLFVSASAGPTSTGHTTFFSYHDLNRHPGPTATIRRSGALAADGGGVVIATGAGPLTHWVPARAGS